MDGRPTWTDCDEVGDYVVPYVLSPRDQVSRPDIMDETVPHTSASLFFMQLVLSYQHRCFTFSNNVSNVKLNQLMEELAHMISYVM